MSQSEINTAIDQEVLYLTEVEIIFKDDRPACPIFVKLKSGGDARKSRRFGRDTPVTWDFDNYLRIPMPMELSIRIKEAHRLRRNTDIVTFKLNVTSEGAIKGDIASVEVGKAIARLTCALPTDELAQRLVEEARTANGNKKVLLESLGKFGKVVAVLMKFTDFAADVHPAVKAAFKVVDFLYEQCKGQRECHEATTELMKDLSSFLPFITSDDHDHIKNVATRRTIKEMLELFCKISGFVVEYSGKAMLGDLFSSKKDDISSLKGAFERLKGTYDWSIKMDVWRSVISTEGHVEDAQLRQLHPAGQASYDIGKMCLEGTRTGVLEKVEAWVASDSKLFWLHGVAGSGKSAIANSVAHMFWEQQQLAGCFFCKRDDPECREPKNVMPTLAYDISKWHAAYRLLVLSAVKGGDELKLTKSLQWQFKLLFKETLSTLAATPENTPPKSLVVVIDALDECGGSDSRSELAEMLLEIASVVPWLKIFIASRPLPELKHVFFGSAARSLVLDINIDIISGIVEGDILQYTRFCAEKYKIKLLENQITDLASKASGLFIWIFTAFRYIDGEIDQQDAISKLLGQNSAGSQESELDSVYNLVLKDTSARSNRNAQIVKVVLSAIICTAKNRPLPEDALFEFLVAVQDDLSQIVVKNTIDKLQAVLYRDESRNGAIRVCHPSFLDFMNTEMRSHEYWTEPTSMDSIMATRCLEVMLTQLKFNICDLETSHLPNDKIQDLHNKITKHIPQHLQYSCLYWMDHLASSSLDASDKELQKLLENLFCHSRSLFWLECLSTMGQVKSGIDILEAFSKWYKLSGMPSAMAHDLYRLVTANYIPISVSTPHLYISALSWAPTESIVARQLYPYFSNQPLITSGKEKNWKTTLWTSNAGIGINAVAYSPDGRHIVSGSYDKALRIWDAQTGSPVGEPLTGHSDRVWSVAYSPDGRHIVSGSEDKTLRIWDTQTGSPVGEPLTGHSGIVWSIAYSPNGRYIVSGSYDKTLRIWDAQTGSPVGQPLTGHLYQVKSVAYSPDGKHIVSGSGDKTLRIWDAQTGSPVREPLTGHSRIVWSVAYSPNGRYIVSGSDDKTLRIWDAQTGIPVGEPLTGHSRVVWSVAYSPNGRYIVSGSEDNTLRIWDAQTGSPVGEPLTGHSDRVWSIAYSPDGRYIVSGSDDNTLRIWGTQTGSPVGEPLTGHSKHVWCVAYSSDGRHIVSGSGDNTLRIWDAHTGSPVGEPLTGHSRVVWCAAYSPDGRHILSGSEDNTLRIWDAQTGSQVGKPLTGHSGTVWSVAYSPDGRHIVSGSDDNTLRIWDAQTGSPVGGPLIGHSDSVWSVAYSPDGKHIVSGLGDKTLRIWDAQTGSQVGKPLTGHSDWVRSVAYSPNGRHIVSGSDDKILRIWDAQTGSPVGETLTGHSGYVLSAAYSPDGRYIVSGSGDKTLRIWDAQTGSQVGQPLTGHSGTVRSVAYSPDGSHIVSGSEDNTLRVWDANNSTTFSEVDKSFFSNRIDDDGWLRDQSGNLLFWFPYMYHHTVFDTSILSLPAHTDGHSVGLDWRKLSEYSGSSWVNILSRSDYV
ncbi:hypothetical protein M0805_006517 [Coniferiporia weirii]|nr:hypothetical protein M0805_006517 [Coniferiporia weirii]